LTDGAALRTLRRLWACEARERWLAAVWPFVRGQLPDPSARLLEGGCGPAGGFVPMLHAGGYDATGVDPEAPPVPWYVQAEVERSGMPEPAAAIVACAYLHPDADLGQVPPQNHVMSR
jgi:hypothetical protein